MKKHIEESTVRLTAGILELLQTMTLAMEAQGAIDRPILTYAIETRLAQHTNDELDAVPLAMMLRFLRPESPPHPTLRLIQGGKV